MENKKMYAIRLNAPNDYEYTEVDMPTPGLYEVLCKVEAVSICGTDPHIIAGDFPGVWPKQFPLVPGHEWAGTIVELGGKSAEFGFRVGDRVAGISHVGCGHCKNCLEGRYTLCLNYGNEKVHRQYGHISQGAYAQYMAAGISAIAKIPDDMDFNLAACMDPLSIALHMVMRSKLEPGDSVFISGSGAQGLMSIICAKAMGAGKIIVSGSGNRLEAAKKLGATTIDYRTENIVEKVLEYTDGSGAKRVMECAGTQAGITAACNACAKGGCISVIGLPKGEVMIPIRKIVLDEIDFVGNRANPNTLEKSIVIADHYKKEIQSLITHEFPMSKYREALEIFKGRLDNSLKVIVKPQF